jgi:hypothetical protein
MAMRPQQNENVWYGPQPSRPGFAREVDWSAVLNALEQHGIPRDLVMEAAPDPLHIYGEPQRELSRRLLDLVKDSSGGSAPVRQGTKIADSVVNDTALMMLEGQVPEELVDLLRWQLRAVGRAEHVSKAAPGARRRAAFLSAYNPQASLRDIAVRSGANFATVSRWRGQASFQRDVERISAFFEKNQLDRCTGKFGSGGRFTIVGRRALSSGPNRRVRLAPELILPPFEELTPKDVDRILWRVRVQI